MEINDKISIAYQNKMGGKRRLSYSTHFQSSCFDEIIKMTSFFRKERTSRRKKLSMFRKMTSFFRKERTSRRKKLKLKININNLSKHNGK